MERVEQIAAKYRVLKNVLDEAAARAWAATEAMTIGRGGIEAVSKATGMSRRRIREGLRELDRVERSGPAEAERRIRSGEAVGSR